jgi:hypothetical protein
LNARAKTGTVRPPLPAHRKEADVRTSRIALIMALALALPVRGTLNARAQADHPDERYIPPHVIETPFPFQAGGRILPAGKYVIEQPVRDHLTFRADDGFACEALILTRLAEPLPQLTDAHVTFDKVGDMYYASEVWIPQHDGFLLNDSMVAVHSHFIIRAVKK